MVNYNQYEKIDKKETDEKTEKIYIHPKMLGIYLDGGMRRYGNA